MGEGMREAMETTEKEREGESERKTLF
jgi:hypothetical protein